MTEYLTYRQAIQATLDGEALEYLNSIDGWKPVTHTCWCDLKTLDSLSHQRLAMKPVEMITRTITYPKPESEPLTVGQMYWCVCDLEARSFPWLGSHVDTRYLLHGLIHLTQEAATAHAKALIGDVG
jgi:hypothetical protein